jgi:hypothetical protein
VRTLIASLACAAALLVAALPANASPVGGRPDPRYTPSMQSNSPEPVAPDFGRPSPDATPSSQPGYETPPAPVVHELHTVIRERDAGRTAAFVLSGAALLIAAGAAAFTTVSARRRTATS